MPCALRYVHFFSCCCHDIAFTGGYHIKNTDISFIFALRIPISPSQVDIALLNVRLSYLVVIKITFEFGIYNRALSTGLRSIQRFRARGYALASVLS